MRLINNLAVLAVSAAVILAPASFAQDDHDHNAVRVPATNVEDGNKVALAGFDPVMLVTGEEVEGKEDLFIDRAGFRYRFTTQENKELFESEPGEYEIQMDGNCATMGEIAGNPNLYTVHDEKIYIFGSPNCREDFLAEPEAFLEG